MRAEDLEPLREHMLAVIAAGAAAPDLIPPPTSSALTNSSIIGANRKTFARSEPYRLRPIADSRFYGGEVIGGSSGLLIFFAAISLLSPTSLQPCWQLRRLP